jgi:hypothetical protein
MAGAICWPFGKFLAAPGMASSDCAETFPLVSARMSKTEHIRKIDFLADMATLPG